MCDRVFREMYNIQLQSCIQMCVWQFDIVLAIILCFKSIIHLMNGLPVCDETIRKIFLHSSVDCVMIYEFDEH